MELDELLQDWKNVPYPAKNQATLSTMLKEANHPVLKQIRIQLVIELAGWMAFILLSYAMFDAHKRPIWIVLISLSSLLAPIIHHFVFYRLTRESIGGDNLRLSMHNYMAKLKRYALVNLLLRICLFAGLLLFFTYGLKLNTRRLTSGIVILSIFTIQLILLSKLWKKRISRLANTLSELEN